MKDFNTHKIKFSPYLEKLYNSDKPLIIYKVNDGYNLYTDFSKKIILTNNNINNFFNLFSKKQINRETRAGAAQFALALTSTLSTKTTNKTGIEK